MSVLYELFYRPFFNALFFIYGYIAFEDLGLAIIMLTILVRLFLFPVFHKSVKHQAIMQKIQPKVREIQEAHKENREKQTKELMNLYKEHNVNPFSGFILLLIQLPIFIGLYQVFSQKFTAKSFEALYSFVPQPMEVHATFFGLINLYESSIVLVVLAAIFQFLQGWLTLQKAPEGKEPGMMERVSRQMVFMGPMVTVLILWSFPSAIALYWVTTSAFSVLQQVAVMRGLNRPAQAPG